MSNLNRTPFSLLADPSSALAAAQRLSQMLPSRTSTLDGRKGKSVSDELARFDQEVESGR
jgi:hypothetical protein